MPLEATEKNSCYSTSKCVSC